MYTRSYYPDTTELPENYGGMAMRPDEPIEENCATESERSESASITHDSVSTGLAKSPVFSSLFSRLGGLTRPLGIEKIGTEELLIIGVALYLLFSKSGDKECAIILLLLLLVN